MNLREAAQAALASMDQMLNMGEWYQAQERADALRAALAQPVPEPMSATAETDLHAELMREHADHREMTELAGRVLAENERLRAALVAAAHHQPAPLTDAQIDQITAEQWGRGLGAPYAAYRAYARAVLAAAGIVPAPTTGEKQ